IVELQGTTGSAPAIDRKKGFEEELAKHPDMAIIKSQTADFTRAKGKEVMEAFIKSDREQIQAVYAHNDDMALGAIQALEEAGRGPGKDVPGVASGGVTEACEATGAGTLNATAECSPRRGPVVFDTIEKLRAGEQVPKYTQSKDQLFDQGSAA